MREKSIAGNWKMHTTTADARRLAKAIADGVGMEDRVCVAVCPPFPYLAGVGEILKGSRIALGAQNLYPEKEGAFTGEVSPTMLLDLGCKYVILGHSERRQKLAESNEFINQKVRIALAAGLDVMLCVGETLDQRNDGQTEMVLDRELTEGLAGLSADTLPRLSVAYEPIWAIGNTGHHATPQQVQQAHAVIRLRFGRMFGRKSAETLVIQYGGSVKPENAASLLGQPVWTAPSSAAPALMPTSFWQSSGLGSVNRRPKGNHGDCHRTTHPAFEVEGRELTHATTPLHLSTRRNRMVTLRPIHRSHGSSIDRARRKRGTGTPSTHPAHLIYACTDQPAATRPTNVCAGWTWAEARNRVGSHGVGQWRRRRTHARRHSQIATGLGSLSGRLAAR
jgi:triosephosphate isomerase